MQNPFNHLFAKSKPSQEAISAIANKAFDEIAEQYAKHPKNWNPSQTAEIKRLGAIKLDSLAALKDFKNGWLNLLEKPPF